MNRKTLVPFLILGLYALVIVAVPLAFLLYNSAHISLSPLFLSVLISSIKQSFLQSTISTSISLTIGLAMGIFLILYSGMFRRAIISLLLVTYVMPGIIMGLGIISLFGYSSRLWEIIYGNVIYNAPMIAALAYSTGSTTNVREVYSAKMLGATNYQVIRKFYLRNSLRGGLLGGILTFILTFEGFSLPLIIGGPSFSTMEVMIYEFKRVIPTFSTFPFSSSAFIAIIQIVLLLTPLYFYLSIGGGQRRGEGELEFPLKSYSTLSLAILLVFLGVVLAPLAEVFIKYPIWQMSFLEIHERLGIPVGILITNTLLYAFASTFVAFLIAMFIAIYRPSRSGQFIVLTPLILSPVSVALAYFLLYGSFVPTSILIILIFTAIIIPLTMRMVSQAIGTIPGSEAFSSQSLGDSKIASFFKVQLPRIRRDISVVLSVMFITVMGEFSSIVTVYTRSTETLTVGIYQLLQSRDIKDTYGLTEVLLIVIFISSFIINSLGRSGSLGQT